MQPFLRVDSQSVQSPQTCTYSRAVLWEPGLLTAEFSAAACFSPSCPWGRVLIWSQVRRPAERWSWPEHHFPYLKWLFGKSLLNQVSGKGPILV